MNKLTYYSYSAKNGKDNFPFSLAPPFFQVFAQQANWIFLILMNILPHR